MHIVKGLVKIVLLKIQCPVYIHFYFTKHNPFLILHLLLDK